jgi:PIN domain nuclease of toxin-antitoxin system
MEKGHNISISQITLFELSAKGAKYVNNGTLLPETVTEGIRAILYDDEIEIVPFHDSKLLLTSFKFRNILTDFIDCLIVATAINHCDALITEDEEIHKLTKKNGINELLEVINPNFKIKRMGALL